jgi:hypothetical protein
VEGHIETALVVSTALLFAHRTQAVIHSYFLLSLPIPVSVPLFRDSSLGLSTQQT